MTFESFPHPPARRATHVMFPGRSGLGRTIAHATPHCSLHPPAGSRPAAQSWPLHVARWASRFADASSPGGAHSGIFTVSSPSPQALRTAGRRPLREAHSTTAHHPPRLALTPRLPCARRAAVCLTCPAPPLSIARDPQNPRRTCWPGPVDGRACDAARLSSSPTALPPPCGDCASFWLSAHTFSLPPYRYGLRRLRRVDRLRPAMPKPPPTPAASRIINTRDPISRIVGLH